MILLQKKDRKEIDTAPIARRFSVGECRPEPVILVLDRFTGDSDLSEWQFCVTGVNTIHEPVSKQATIRQISKDTVSLLWEVDGAFLQFAGVLHLELQAKTADNTKCIVFRMDDIWVSPSVWGNGMPTVARMQEIYCQKHQLYDKMMQLSLHLPKISDVGTWMLYDSEIGTYVDSSIRCEATRITGITLDKGADGNIVNGTAEMSDKTSVDIVIKELEESP